MKLVMGITDYIYVLNYGQIAQGDPTAVKNNPEVIKAYLGVKYMGTILEIKNLNYKYAAIHALREFLCMLMREKL